MAQTLIVRPYVFAASSRAARSLFLRQAQPTKPFVSAVLFTRARTKLRSHSKDGIGEAYGNGRSSGFGFPPVGGRCFSSPAAHVNDAGSVESPLMQSMEKKVSNVKCCAFIGFLSGKIFFALIVELVIGCSFSIWDLEFDSFCFRSFLYSIKTELSSLENLKWVKLPLNLNVYASSGSFSEWFIVSN